MSTDVRTWDRFTRLLAMLVVAIGVGLILSLSQWLFTHAAVSNVVGIDNDTGANAGYGVDGRDVSISWTLGAEPAGFQAINVYLLQEGTSLTTSSVGTACNNTPAFGDCFELCEFHEYGALSCELPPFEDRDSDDQTFVTSSDYVAWVMIDSSTNSLDEIVSSSPFSLTFDIPADGNAPFVDHIPVHTVIDNTNGVFTAMIFDDQTIPSAFASTTDGGSEFARLYYGSDVSVSTDFVNGEQIFEEVFTFTVPNIDIPATGGTLEYYIIVADAAGNTRYVCIDGEAAAEATCQAAAQTVNVVDAGPATISGSVSDTQFNALDAFILPGGFAIAPASSTSLGGGTFTFSNFPTSTIVDLQVFADGYCPTISSLIMDTTFETPSFTLSPGECEFFGDNGAAGPPQVVFSGPREGDNSVPKDITIMVGFNQPMSAVSINDENAAMVDQDNTVLYDADGMSIDGRVTYCSSNADPGCSSIGDAQNILMYNPVSDLATNTEYVLVMNDLVLNESGQSIIGNRDGGGHTIFFRTAGDAINLGNIVFGGNGEFMPPYVQYAVPVPGQTAAPNTDVVFGFNSPMDASTLTTTNVTLTNIGTQVAESLDASDLVLETNEKKRLTIDPGTLSAGEYEVCVKGAVADIQGMTMLDNQDTEHAFCSFFVIAGGNDSTAPTIYPGYSDGDTGIPVNAAFEFGFNEQIFVSASDITLKRGTTNVGFDIDYDPGDNVLLIAPTDVLAPNTSYTLSFAASGINDLAGNTILTAQSYTYTTGAFDSVRPQLKKAQCDDWSCRIEFSEPMNSANSQDFANVLTSVTYADNINLYIAGEGSTDFIGATQSISYDSFARAVTIEGLDLLTNVGNDVYDKQFTLTMNNGVTDLTGNVIDPTATSTVGTIEDARETFGAFGDEGMFTPAAAGQEHVYEGFGSIPAADFHFGGGSEVWQFNSIAGQDVDVFHMELLPTVALADGDQIEIEFPSGMDISGAVPDTFSPYYEDMNSFESGTIAFDTSFDGDGVSVDTVNNKVTIQVDVTGSPSTTDRIIIDLRTIINPAIPRDPFSTGGYSITAQFKRSGVALASVQPNPFFVEEGGTNSIVLNLYADDQGSPDNVSGEIFVHARGPGSDVGKSISMIAGQASTTLSNLFDTCYFISTEPSVTMGGSQYNGQPFSEPVCVDSGNPSETLDIVLPKLDGTNSVDITVEFANGVDFGGADIEIGAFGPGPFVVTTTYNAGDQTGNSYVLKIPNNGDWSVGFHPAPPKGSSQKVQSALACAPPPPISLKVAGVGGAATVDQGYHLPPGVTFDTDTDTVTFTCGTADKTITGTVVDGNGTGLSGVEVFVHSQGLMIPTITETASDGTFTASVSDLGSYEVGVHKDGLPPTMKFIELRPDGDDAGNDPDNYFEGKQVTNANPLELKMKKSDYTISGKVLDTDGNSIAGAPVFAIDSDGRFVPGGMSDADGSYVVFVDVGTWTVRSELPPSETDACGTLSKTVVVTTESKSSQNIQPTESTCYATSGTVTIGGSTQAGVPVDIMAWDSVNDRPSGEFFRHVNTDSSGLYTAKVPGNTDYKACTFDPDFGEYCTTSLAEVATANVSNAHINSGDTAAITFAFTGGRSDMGAFIEIRKDDDRHTRFGKPVERLDTNTAISVKEGTYNYFVDVFGFGKFDGTALTGTTVTIDLSTSDFLNVTGTIKDDNGAVVAGAVVRFENATDGTLKTAITDDTGEYDIDIKSGEWEVFTKRAGFIGVVSTSVTFTTDTPAFDVGGDDPDITAMARGGYTIKGVLYESDGTTPMDKGFVEAENADGRVVSSPVDSDNGAYTLSVANGVWTLRAVGPLHARSTRSGTVTISGADQAGIDITLTADATREPKSASDAISATSGGSFNDNENSNMKMTAGPGVLQSADGDVTVSFEKNFAVPQTDSVVPLGDAGYEISARGTSEIKSLNGNVEIQIDFCDMADELPDGITTSSLKLMYYSPERDDYIPVEGGSVIDEDNCTAIGSVNHFTSFIVGYDSGSVSSGGSEESGGGGSNNSGGGGGGGSSSGGFQFSSGSSSAGPTVPASYPVIAQETVTHMSDVEVPTEVTVGEHAHTVTFITATEDSVTVTIASEPQTVTVKNGETEIMDTDIDGINDLSVTYNGMVDGQPSIELVNLTDSNEMANAVTIQSGAYETESTAVTLSFNVEDATLVAVSNVPSFVDTEYVTYSETMGWVLAEGNGEKTVYVRFRDAEGGMTDRSDTIMLTGQDFDAPEEVEYVPVSCSLEMKKAYKHANSPAVYYVTDMCTKRPFKSSKMYFTYFSSWSDMGVVPENSIMNIPNDELSFMPWGPKYDPQYGALVKVVSDPKVYLLLGGEKYWITSEAVFTGLKYAWNWVEDIADELLDNYATGSEITRTDVHPNYTLVKYAGGAEVYRLEPDPADAGNTVKRHVKDEATFISLGYRWDRIVSIDTAEQYDDGDQITTDRVIRLEAK